MPARPPITQAVRAKLAASAGETLVETLAAVIVSALGVLMLVMAVSVATNMIRQSETTAAGYYAASDALASGTVNGNEGLGDDGGNASVAIAFEGFGVLKETEPPITSLKYVWVNMPGVSSPVVSYQQATGEGEEG